MRACIDCKLAARVASSNAKTLHYRDCLNRADYCDVNKEPMTNILRPVSMEPFRAPSLAQWAFEKLREHRLRVLITTPHHDATSCKKTSA